MKDSLNLQDIFLYKQIRLSFAETFDSLMRFMLNKHNANTQQSQIDNKKQMHKLNEHFFQITGGSIGYIFIEYYITSDFV
jgi:hypothetical protein